MKLRLSFLFYILSVLSIQVQGANPELDWKTHESDNFLVHYPASLSLHVDKVVRYSESSHLSLSEFFNWQPNSKTHVVLIDDFDQSNGYAQPMPNNAMTLFMQPPTSGELLVYDDWLKMLIHHEYTHILHMDKVLGFPAFLRKVFGRIFFTFPNSLHPNWFAEGLATYQETDSDKGIGRGQSDLFEIMMRSEITSGLKPVSRINTVSGHNWPLNTAYLYGVYFFKFIRDVYGESAIKSLINNYSDNVIPYHVGSNSIAVTGKDLDELWIEFDRYLKGYFSPQIQRIKVSKENKFEIISSDKAAYGLLAKEGEDTIWFSALDRQLGIGLYRYQLGEMSRVTNLNSLATIDVNDRGAVLVSQLEYCGKSAQYYDLYILNEDESLVKITDCARYRLAKWVDHERILALRYESAKPVFDLLDATGNLIRTFWQGTSDVVISGFDIDSSSESEFNLVATIKFSRENWNLYQFNNNDWSALTDTVSIQSNPVIKGESLFYVQSQIGQSEAYEQSALKTKRLTHNYTGLKQILPIDDYSAWALRYESTGYELVRIELGSYKSLYEKSNRKSRRKDSEQLSNDKGKGSNATILSEPYSAIDSLLPSYWFPVYLSNEHTKQVGFFTSGADALNIQQYTFQMANETISDKWLLNASYIYDSRFFIGLQQGVDFILDAGSVSVYEKKSQWILGAMKPYVQFDRQVYPYIAITQSEDYFFSGQTSRLLSSVNNDNWLALGVIYDQFNRTHWSGDIESGVQLKTSIETSELVDNNLQESTVLNFDTRVYTPLFNGHTLAQRLFLGGNLEGGSSFQLGGTTSDVYIGPGIQVKQRQFSLRGYSSNSSKLKGDNALLHSIEYRLPVDWHDSTFMAPPVGFSGWSMRGFIDTGSAWDGDLSAAKFYSGVGAEAILDVTLGYYLGLRVRIGAAKGFGSEADDSIYMELGGAF